VGSALRAPRPGSSNINAGLPAALSAAGQSPGECRRERDHRGQQYQPLVRLRIAAARESDQQGTEYCDGHHQEEAVLVRSDHGLIWAAATIM
jgi:hypothetical protein